MVDKNYECWDINGGVLEYFDDTHTYIYNGIVLPSITTIMGIKFGNKYNGVDPEVLKKAAVNGTRVHNIIEQYYKKNVDVPECKELRNMKFLQKLHGFKVKDNEIPVVLYVDGKPVSAGRLDLVLEIDGEIGLGDIKRTSGLDKEYLSYQLNLYRIAYIQSYGIEPKFLKGIHLRNDVRRFVDIPIREDLPLQLVNEYLEGKK